MKKNIVKKSIALLITVVFLAQLQTVVFADKKEQIRGVWVASVLNLDYPKSQARDDDLLKAYALDVLDRAEQVGFNAVFLQVRPTADALYKSDIFPWSVYLTGTAGVAPKNDFDPLQFWVEEAHKRDIELHAWINPYRITKRLKDDPEPTIAALPENHPARLHPEWVVSHGKGDLYFNPALPEVQDLIARGVAEVVQNYDVDGIHFDDYFYPGTDFDDAAAYQLYGDGIDLGDWRRANVNAMVRKVYQTVKSIDRDVQFGISPFGIWANQGSLQSGSATRGNQSYFSHYADSLAWIDEGIIDYIAPQIYWHIGFDIADYSTLVDWWVDKVRGSAVDLIIGQAAYRVDNAKQSSPWQGYDQLFRQLAYNMTKPEIAGSIFFRDGSFQNAPALISRMINYYDMVDEGDHYREISINFPFNNYATDAAKTYIAGYANPYKQLDVNGEQVVYRSPKGFFGVQVALENGQNVFTFSQGDSERRIVIYRGKKPESPASSRIDPGYTPADKPKVSIKKAIITDSAYPQRQEMYQPGAEITLACKAPIGATVEVVFNGETLALNPALNEVEDEVMLTTFSRHYNLPDLAPNQSTMLIAAPVYSMTYKGVRDVVVARGNYSVIAERNPYRARVIKPHIDTYFKRNPRKGSDYILEEGMVDTVLALTDKYVQLGSGRWTYRSNVSLFYDRQLQSNVVTKASYHSAERFDYIEFEMPKTVAVALQLKDGVLSAVFADTVALPNIKNDTAGLIGKVETEVEEGRASYKFIFKNFADLHGYYTEVVEGGVRLYLKKPVKARDGAEPLDGISILIDPGHGGDDSGALGLMGADFSEKHINMEMAKVLKNELEYLGAKVYLTRRADDSLSLQDRLRMSFEIKPDMFISLHADSINPEKDLSYVSGFSVHYKREIAAPLANAVHDIIQGQLKRRDRKVKVNNFYVVRGTWAPSILLEAGFVPNAMEFEWMTERRHQIEYAAAIAQGIVQFFGR